MLEVPVYYEPEEEFPDELKVKADPKGVIEKICLEFSGYEYRRVTKTNNLFEEKFDIHCLGITGPYGYYRGLMDRPEVLDVLYHAGIRFIRTYMRNENDWGPLSIQVQPFSYESQGFPEILEIPSQGWQDVHYFWVYGWNKREEFLDYNKRIVDEITHKNLAWSACQYDWTSCQRDPRMSYTRNLLSYAQSKGMIVTSHRIYYEKTKDASTKH